MPGQDSFPKHAYTNHYQRILFARPSHENTLKFLIKAIIGKTLYNQKTSFVTEWKYKVGKKIIDIMPLIDLDNSVIYRFGKSDNKIKISHNKFREKNIVIKDLNIDLSWIKELEKRLQEKII